MNSTDTLTKKDGPAETLALAPGSAFTVRAYKGAPDIKVTHVRGNRYRVDMDGATYYRLCPQPGEWLEAGKFFPGDDDKDGKAVTVKGPIYKRELRTPTSFELRFRFDVLLHNG